MQTAAAMGQSWGLIVLQKSGIFLPFCLFFCVLQWMQMEAMEDDGCMVMFGTGISLSRKNSKSVTIKVSGGCKGQEVVCLKKDRKIWHHSEAKKPT